MNMTILTCPVLLPGPDPRKLRTSIEPHLWKILSTFGDKCPQNCSKREPISTERKAEMRLKGPRMDQVYFLFFITLEPRVE